MVTKKDLMLSRSGFEFKLWHSFLPWLLTHMWERAVSIKWEREGKLLPCLAHGKCLIDSIVILKCFPNYSQVFLCNKIFLKINVAFWRKRKWHSPLKWTWRLLEGLFQVVIKHLWSKFAHFCPHQSYNIPGIKSALEFKNKTVEQTELEVLGRHPPQQNVLSIGGMAIKKKMYTF